MCSLEMWTMSITCPIFVLGEWDRTHLWIFGFMYV